MVIPLLLLAGVAAGAPFPIEPGADPELHRLHLAWTSPATDGDERAEMRDRLLSEAAAPRPDWRAAAEGYFAWRNAAAAARDAQNAIINIQYERVKAAIAARPLTCTTRTRREKGLYGNSYSHSTTTCEK